MCVHVSYKLLRIIGHISLWTLNFDRLPEGRCKSKVSIPYYTVVLLQYDHNIVLVISWNFEVSHQGRQSMSTEPVREQQSGVLTRGSWSVINGLSLLAWTFRVLFLGSFNDIFTSSTSMISYGPIHSGESFVDLPRLTFHHVIRPYPRL
jgi:hypothetical protein